MAEGGLTDQIVSVLAALRTVKRADSEAKAQLYDSPVLPTVKGYWITSRLIRLDIQGEEEQLRSLLENL